MGHGIWLKFAFITDEGRHTSLLNKCGGHLLLDANRGHLFFAIDLVDKEGAYLYA